MKKIISLLLTTCVVLSVTCACAEKPLDTTATEDDIAKLESLYADRQAYHGELHDHANTGGWSDGKNALPVWKAEMQYVKDMDFAVIADHKQVLHMVHPDWDDTLFIGGTEAGTEIQDPTLERNVMHYNMLFAELEGFEKTLLTYPGYRYEPSADHSNRYYYAKFTHEEMTQVSQTVLDNGGFFVHLHPMGDSYILSDDPLDYMFADYTGLEVLCGYYGNMSAENNQEAYKLWTDLLALGKRIYATSGSDSHKVSRTVSLTTLYASEKNSKAYLNTVCTGDFTAGPVGIRMAVDETPMGGECSFEGKRLVLSVGDFHSVEFNPAHTYRVDLYDDRGLIFSQTLSGNETAYFAIDTDNSAKFYRAEVFNVTENYQFALGNPIWNS